MTNKKPIYIVGDVHGHWDLLQSTIKQHEICDCVIICVGDLGIGFVNATNPEKETRIHDMMNSWFANRNINFYSIRGNHDDPAFFDGSVNLSHFKLLPDYTSLVLNEETFLFVGGAISVDRIHRKLDYSYWADEKLTLQEDRIVQCDVLITHTAPTWNGPLDKSGLNNFCDWTRQDPSLWDECLQERKDVDQIIRGSKAKMHYCGHFHSYHWVDHCETYSTILGILQFKEHKQLS